MLNQTASTILGRFTINMEATVGSSQSGKRAADEQSAWAQLHDKYLTPSAVDRHRLIMSGVPTRELKLLLKAGLPMSADELQQVLGCQPPSQGWRPSRLTFQVSNAFVSLLDVSALAARVLGSREEAFVWLRRHLHVLGGFAPIELITTAAGVEAVETLLLQLEGGVYL